MMPSRIIILVASLLPLLPSCVSQNVGESCRNGCSGGLTCNRDFTWRFDDQKCYHAPRLLNEPCVWDRPECASGLECMFGWYTVASRCGIRRKFGEPCNDYDLCSAYANSPTDLLCNSGTCYHLYQLEGEPCHLFGTDRICYQNGFFCHKPSGTCHRRATMPCLDATKTVMDAIDTSYKTKGVTSRSVDVAGSKLLFDDFSTNGANNLAYQLACEDQGAKYVELHYDAQCVTGINKTVSLFVRGQPRCYAKTCTDVDGQSLLAMFSLGPTEKRAQRDSNSTNKWVCSGQLRNASWNFCRDNTKSINEKDDMQIADFDLTPTVSTQKFLVFNKAEKLVTFPAAGKNFTSTCERNGGVVRVVKNARVVCGKSHFSVQAFTTCLWPLCGPNTEANTQIVIAQQIQTKLKKLTQSNVKISGSCVLSSASTRVSVGFVTVAVIVVGAFEFSVIM
jgi:hypothetical protein